MPNQIRHLETRALAGRDGDLSAIMCAIDVEDLASASPFVKDVQGQVLMQRMISPPDTSLMLVTLMGPLGADDFAQLWREHVATDEALRAFMAQLRRADVVHGDEQGRILGQASLIAADDPRSS